MAGESLRRHVNLHLRHHDRASLLAGKLQAIFNRPYTKGRDWFDAWWYLSQPAWPLPNFAFLKAGLLQANPSAPLLSAGNWKKVLRSRVLGLDWSVVLRDVEPFIIDLERQAGFSQDGLLDMLA